MNEDRMWCLTLDLEDAWSSDDPALDHCVLDHLDAFIALMTDLDLPLSVFVVGQTLERFPEAVDKLDAALDCEFHLHSYQHDMTKSYDFETEVRQGMAAFREYFGRDPVGYRAPQGNIEPKEFAILESLGFEFDSSVFPSYRPGMYNNLDAPLEPFIPDVAPSLVEIPFGAFRGIRIPTSHSYFKLFGRPLGRYLTVAGLPNVLVYNIHLHDLYRTPSHEALNLPKRWIMKRNLDRSKSLLRANVKRIRDRGYESVLISDIERVLRTYPDAFDQVRTNRQFIEGAVVSVGGSGGSS